MDGGWVDGMPGGDVGMGHITRQELMSLVVSLLDGSGQLVRLGAVGARHACLMGGVKIGSQKTAGVSWVN